MRDRIRAALSPASPRRASAAATGRCPKCGRDFEGCTCGTENPNRGGGRRNPGSEVRH